MVDNQDGNFAFENNTRLGDRYVIQSRISAGGMGDVYRALDESNRVSVAIKTIQPRFLDDPKIQSMFHREGRLLSSRAR